MNQQVSQSNNRVNLKNNYKSHFDSALVFQNPYYQYMPISFNNAKVEDLLNIHLKKILNRECKTEKGISILLKLLLQKPASIN